MKSTRTTLDSSRFTTMTTPPRHLTMDDLQSGLGAVRASPADDGVLEMIVRRPSVDARELVNEGRLDREQGLVGDGWRARALADDPKVDPDASTQLTLMNARVIQLIAQDRERWCLAGDQLYVDLDLSSDNLPPGTLLRVGGAVIQVSAEPHTGCRKFVSRYGLDAMKFVNSEVGRRLNLRGLNARVIEDGVVRVGDRIRKCVSSAVIGR